MKFEILDLLTRQKIRNTSQNKFAWRPALLTDLSAADNPQKDRSKGQSHHDPAAA